MLALVPMRLFGLALVVLLSLLASEVNAKERIHVVASGHTLSRIGERYHVSIEALCRANGIVRNKPIHPGQRLIIPDPSDKDGEQARQRRLARETRQKAQTAAKKSSSAGTAHDHGSKGMQTLQLGSTVAYYYEPVGPGRLTLRPVLMYLHGRGGHAVRDCRRWAPIARRLGWLVCPAGPGANGIGKGWNNNWAIAEKTSMLALNALRKKYGRRVQLYGNTLMGFSEGALVAMNVGLRQPRAFNRWLILAGDSTYWGGPGRSKLSRVKKRVRRVYLITGEKDGVVAGTRRLRTWLRKAAVATRITTPDDMGHELALERKRELYRMALIWLDRGATRRPAQKKGPAVKTASR